MIEKEPEYLVWYDGETEEVAYEVLSALDKEDAVVEALEFYDSNSHFSEGYPDQTTFFVKEISTGVVCKVKVDTDWTPNFYVYNIEEV